MSLWSVFLIGVGVSADAFAAALACGLRMHALRYRRAAVIAFTFAGFQAAMPLVGWLLASQFTRLVDSLGHWIAFALLVTIGGKMIWDIITGHHDHEPEIGTQRLLGLGFATSIDAAAVGISFAMLKVAILPSIIIIGLTTFSFSFVAVLLGHRIGLRFRGPAEFIGGAILILIGVRILLA